MTRSLLSLLIVPAVLLFSCGDADKPATTTTDTVASTTTTTTTTSPAGPETDLGAEGTNGLMDVLAAYYSLKDALVATDGAKADEAASKLMSAAELFHSGMGQVPKKNEIQAQLRVVMDGTEAIMSSKDEAIEDKRQHFAGVSEAMYQVAKLSNLRNGGVYQQFCPMAFNDKGAYWLSPESDIRNPYFGKKMLSCGEVRDSL